MIKPIPQQTSEYARNLRKNPTVWETKLWNHLKEKNLGPRFKRQVYIGGYLADLSCNSKKLIIEIDGAYHRDESTKLHDNARTEFLKREGYRVLRFWNSEIDKDINSVLKKIIQAIN